MMNWDMADVLLTVLFILEDLQIIFLSFLLPDTASAFENKGFADISVIRILVL